MMAIRIRGRGRRKRWAFAVGLNFVAVSMALGQVGASKPLAFDVISIKPHDAGDESMSIRPTPDGYYAKNLSLKWMIENAYGIKMDNLILDAPAWADSERFDFTGKMDAETADRFKKLPKEEQRKQMDSMLQGMLADRCGLKVHHGTKVISAYALVVAKSGFKLKEADANKVIYANADGIKGATGTLVSGMFMMGPGAITGKGITISNLAANLGGPIDSFVEDKTGINGKYDISLRWDPDPNRVEMQGADGTSPTADSDPSLFTAVQEQLGLKLIPAKVPMETVVIDHVDRPSAN